MRLQVWMVQKSLMCGGSEFRVWRMIRRNFGDYDEWSRKEESIEGGIAMTGEYWWGLGVCNLKSIYSTIGSK